jgi:hypothetical protein
VRTTSKAKIVVAVVTVFVIFVAVLAFVASCPVCGAHTVKLATVADDTNAPSKNLCVWNRSRCGNLFYDANSVICTQCWYSYSKLFSRWERSSELPDSFRRPLSTAIRRFPLPSPKEITSPRVVYSQKIAGARVTESVFFWCTDSPTLLDPFDDYCREHKLSIEFYRAERMQNQVCVTITKKPTA